MDLPFVAQPVFYSFLALTVGLGLLFIPFRGWWFGVSLGDARIHGGIFEPDLIQILIYRLCAIALMLFVEFLLCFVTLFRISIAYDDPDVVANSALEDKVGILLGFWFVVTISTVTILATVGGHVLIAMAYLWEPKYTSGNLSSGIELANDYNEHDMERLPLLNVEQIQSTDIGAVDIDYSTFDWRSEDDTLIPSSPGSLRSNSSSTLCLSDFEYLPFPPPVNIDLFSDWIRHWRDPPLRLLRRHASHDDLIREDILHSIETGSGAQSEFSDADDEMDPADGEDFIPVEAISDLQSEGSDADDEMDEEGSESEPLLRRSRVRQEDGTDTVVLTVSLSN
jgi:hypothetical protein